MKTVLVYSPFMGHTGSEIAIRNLIVHAQNIRYVLLSGWPGALSSAMPPQVPVFVWEEDIWENRWNRVLKRAGQKTLSERRFWSILRRYKPDLVLVNTIVITKVMPVLKASRIPFVVYVHELPPSYALVGAEGMEYMLAEAQAFIACSKGVADSLKRATTKPVYIFYETIDVQDIEEESIEANRIRSDFQSFDRIFVMSGTPSPRKGLHLIIDIAYFLRSRNAALIWVGGRPWPTGLDVYVASVQKQENLHNLFLVGEQRGSMYYSYLSIADAFLLTSIEDPYPLVMLEAAYLRKPIIAFASGGVVEFVKEGMGRVVPLIDMPAYLQAISDFMDGKMPIDNDLLHNEAKKHNTRLRVHEFEKLLLSLM